METAPTWPTKGDRIVKKQPRQTRQIKSCIARSRCRFLNRPNWWVSLSRGCPNNPQQHKIPASGQAHPFLQSRAEETGVSNTKSAPQKLRGYVIWGKAHLPSVFQMRSIPWANCLSWLWPIPCRSHLRMFCHWSAHIPLFLVYPSKDWFHPSLWPDASAPL